MLVGPHSMYANSEGADETAGLYKRTRIFATCAICTIIS